MKKLVMILISLVLFLSWQAYGNKTYLFKNTPIDPVRLSLRAAIENDLNLFLQASFKQDIEVYARKRNLTDEQINEEIRKSLEMIHAVYKKNNVTIEEYEIHQPEDFKSRDLVFVTVKYVGPPEVGIKPFEVPVYKAADGNWYLPQDGSIYDVPTRKIEESKEPDNSYIQESTMTANNISTETDQSNQSNVKEYSFEEVCSYIGLTRQDIIGKFGSGLNMGETHEYNDLSLSFFYDETDHVISVSGNKGFSTLGITIGMNLDEIRRILGTPLKEGFESVPSFEEDFPPNKLYRTVYNIKEFEMEFTSENEMDLSYFVTIRKVVR